MSEAQKTIGREELYEQLWKVPIVRVAMALGYSYPEFLDQTSLLRKDVKHKVHAAMMYVALILLAGIVIAIVVTWRKPDE